MLKLKKKNKLWNSCKWRETRCFVLLRSATLSEYSIDRVSHIHNHIKRVPKKSKTFNRIYPLDVGPKISKSLIQRMKLFKRKMHHTPFYNFICAVLRNNQCTNVIDVWMPAVVVEKENRNQNRVREIKLNYSTISFCQFIVNSSALWTKNVISNLDIKY